MKQKSGITKLVTQKYFKQELISLEKRLDKNSSERLDNFAKAFRMEVQFMGQTIMENLDERLKKFTNRILTAIDPLLQELETRREEREITSDQSIKTTDQLKNHEKRITKLEHASPTI